MSATVFFGTEPAKSLLDAVFVVVDDILLNRRLEFLVAMVNALIVNLLL